MPAAGYKKSLQAKQDFVKQRDQEAEEKLRVAFRNMSSELVVSHPDLFNGKYPAEVKLFAAVCYLATSNSQRAAAMSGVGADTIRKWKQEAPWWEDAQRAYLIAMGDELVSNIARITDKSLKALEDRLDNGDEVVLQKDGSIIRKAVNARDAGMIAAVMIDKQQLLLGRPTSRVERTVDEDLSKLKKEFSAFSKSKTIEGEVIK